MTLSAFSAPVFLSFPVPLPILLLVFSAIVFFAARKPIESWIGPFSFDAGGALFLFVQLLIVGVGLDLLFRALGINDTQTVGMAAENLAIVPIAGISFLLVSAVAEEMFFRGILYTIAGEAGSAILFAFFHFGYGSGVEILGALVAGIILARGRTRYKSIYPGLAAHLVYNLAAVFVLPF